jgi:hypothetical protein
VSLRIAPLVTLGLGLLVALPSAVIAADAPPVPPPAVKGVEVLFSGQQDQLAKNWLQGGTDQPAKWVAENGAAIARDGDIYSRDKFSDFQLHVEFNVPFMPNEHGQGRGNSGVYLQGRYEIQVLDSYGIADEGQGDCAAVYSQSAPLINACKPPLQWQTYDITFRAPRFDATTHAMTEPARVTVIQNGVVVQDNTEIKGPTGGAMDNNVDQPGPVRLQYHGDAVKYRNVWVLPLPPHGADHY